MADRDWTELFSPINLSRGKNFYAVGKVKQVTAEDSGLEVTVHDQVDRHVSVILSNQKLLGIGCSCKEAEDGIYCAHMAAALCRLEKDYGRILIDSRDLGTGSSSKKRPGQPGHSGLSSEPGKAGPTDQGVEEKDSAKKDPAASLILEQDPKSSQKKKLNFSPEKIDLLQKQEEENYQAGHHYEKTDEEHFTEYRYFQGDQFTEGLNLPEESLKEARDLIAAKNYKPVKVSLSRKETSSASDPGGSLTGKALLESMETGYRAWSATLDFGRDKILDSYCSSKLCHYRYDRNSYLERTLCRHQIAAILLTQDYLRRFNPGDSTNDSGQLLMDLLGAGYESDRTPEKQDKDSGPANRLSKNIGLEPYLFIYDHGMEASFRIGKDNYYKIKDITDYVEAMKLHKSRQFGSKEKLLLGRDSLKEASLPWYDFLCQTVDSRQQEIDSWQIRYRTSIRDQEGPVPLKGSLPLLGERLDSFFRLACNSGQPVEANFRTDNLKNKTYLNFRVKDLRLLLEIHADIHPSSHIFQGVIMTGSCPPIFYGASMAYYMEGPYFNGIEEDQTKELKPLLDTADRGRISVRIGRNHLAYFYRRTLPRLQAMDHVDIIEYDQDLIRSYLPPAPEFTCYLDVEDGIIYCRPQVRYKDMVHSLLDLPAEERGDLRLAGYRDRDSEYEVYDLLSHYLRQQSEEDQLMYCHRKDEAVYEFLSQGLDQLSALADIEVTDRFRRLKIRRKAHFQADVSVGNNLMDLRISCDDLSKEELLDILHRYKQKKHFARLENGDYFKIDENETVEALGQLMEALQIPPGEFVEGKMQLPAYRALYLDKMFSLAPDLYTDRDQHYRDLVSHFHNVKDSGFQTPPSLQKILRSYQETGYRWLRLLDENGFGGILADDMGLGKTLQTITLFLADKLEHMERSEEAPATALVICPASLVYNWQEELGRFAPELVTGTITGSPEERQAKIENYKDYDVLISSYDLVRRDIAGYEDCLFRFIVLDEAQYIKNHRTATARSVKLLKGVSRFALTGTPIENRLSELWSIFDFLMPGFLYDYGTFRDDLEIPITRKWNEEALLMLQRMTSPFILRRLKADVLKELPEKMEEVLYARMEEDQQQLYDAQATELLQTLAAESDEDFRANKIKILSQLTRLRQICCDPRMCFDNYEGESAKLELCMELIHNLIEGEHRALIFSQFTTMLDHIKERLDQDEIPYYEITGSTPKEKRIELVHAFNQGINLKAKDKEDSTISSTKEDTFPTNTVKEDSLSENMEEEGTGPVPVFLISLKAGGTGLNLTGADVVIHYDPWWNLAAQNQATDRSHRIGQQKLVTVYRLIAKGTIEERIVDLQKSKYRLAENILGAEDVGNASLSREDLISLLEEEKKFWEAPGRNR